METERHTEREEGLRYNATRALCIISLLSWFAFIVVLVIALYEFVIRRDGDLVGLIGHLIVPTMWFGGVMAVSIGTLWLWRKCDRCRRRLFLEGRPNWSRWWPGMSAIDQKWLKRHALWMNEAPERDYRAKPLLGSYRNAAIVSMTFTGRLRCQWCGHEDGATPDYVVTASE